MSVNWDSLRKKSIDTAKSIAAVRQSAAISPSGDFLDALAQKSANVASNIAQMRRQQRPKTAPVKYASVKYTPANKQKAPDPYNTALSIIKLPSSTPSYTETKAEISRLQSERDAQIKRGNTVDLGAYDRAIQILNDYSKGFTLSGGTTPEERQAIYKDKQAEYEDLAKNRIDGNTIYEWGKKYDINTDEGYEWVKSKLKGDERAADIAIAYLRGYGRNLYAAEGEKLVGELQHQLDAANWSTENYGTVGKSVKPLQSELRQYERENPNDFYINVKGAAPIEYHRGDNLENIDKLSAYNNLDSDLFISEDYDHLGLDAVAREGDRSGWKYMSFEEKAIYYDLLKNQGKEAAYEYLDRLKYVLQKAKTDEINARVDATNKAVRNTYGDFLGSVIIGGASVPLKAVGGSQSFLDNAAHMLAGKEIEPYSPSHALSNASAEMVSEEAQHIDEVTGGWNIGGFTAGDIYQAGVSTAEFATGAVLSPTLYAALMSMDAAQSTAKDVYDRGGDMGQVFWESTAAGAFEYLFEKASLEVVTNKIIGKLSQVQGKGKKFLAGAISSLLSAGTEGSEEVFTEAANYLADLFIMGDQSERQQLIQQYLDAGYSQKDAEAKANEEFGQSLWKAFAGGAIAGGLGSTPAFISSAAENARESHVEKKNTRAFIEQNADTIANTKGGQESVMLKAKEIIDDQNATDKKALQKAYDKAQKSVNTDNYAKDVARVAAEVGKHQLREYEQSGGKALDSLIREKITEYAGTGADTGTLVAAARKMAVGEQLTRAENKAYRQNEEAVNKTVGELRSEEGLRSIASRAIQNAKAAADDIEKTLIKSGVDQSLSENEDIFTVSDDGKTYISGKNNPVSVQKFTKITSGDMTAQLDDGTEVKASDISWGDDVTPAALGTLLDLQKLYGVSFTPELVNSVYQAAKLEGNANGMVISAGIREAFDRGYINQKGFTSSYLSKTPAQMIYDAAHKLREDNAAKKKADQVQNRTDKAKKGEIVYEKSVSKDDLKKLNNQQRLGLQLLNGLAQDRGLTVHVFKSQKVNGKYVSEYAKNGQDSPNGFYTNGEIYIDLNAGTNGQGFMLFTASHELTHYMRAWSEESFNKLADFLVEHYEHDGATFDELVDVKMSQLGCTRDVAYEEVIAGLCESFLTDAHLSDRAAELYRTDKGIANKFKRLLYKIKQRIAEWLKGVDPESALGRYGRQMAQKYDEILDLYVKGLDAAMNNAAYAKNAASTERMEMARYSYDDFVAKPDMNIAIVDDTVTYSINAATRKSVINDAIDNAKAEGKTNGSGNAVVFVKDIDTDIIVSKRSIAHGLDRRLEFSAPVITKIGSILENSILLNELTPKQEAAIGSYVLIGYAEGKTHDYVVRFVVNKYTNEVDSVDVLYAVNTKREPAGITPGGHIAAPPTGSKISIRDLLDYVNRNYPQLLPEDVLKHYGYNARPEGDLGEDILYQQRDADYLSAVERGDMETAQRMVDEAAKAAGYTVKAYHGTPNEFYVFDKERVGKGTDQYGAGFYFATDKSAAEHYGKRVIPSLLSIKKPIRINRTSDGGDLFDVSITPNQAYKIIKQHPMMMDEEESPLGDWFEDYWSEGAQDWMIRELATNYLSIGLLDSDLFRYYPNELHEAIRKVLGYDGVEVSFDNTGEKFYVAWFDNQMKSADPVTYDDKGKVIPLSERFNPDQKDIRYQDRWDDDLFADDTVEGIVAHQYATHSAEIGEVLRNTADIDIAAGTVKNIVSRVMKNNLGAIDERTKRVLTTRIMVELESAKSTDPETVINNMISAVRDVVEEMNVTDDTVAEQLDELKAAFSGKYYLSDEQIKDLKEHDYTLGRLRNELFGKVNIVSKDNLKKSINGGYMGASELSLEGMSDLFTNGNFEQIFGISADEWDTYGYHAPMMLKEAFENLSASREIGLTQIADSEDMDNIAVRIAAEITGAVVQQKYNSRHNPYVSELVEKVRKQQKERNAKRVAEIRQKDRERAKKLVDDIIERHKATRKGIMEKRAASQARNSIRKKIHELDKLLNRSTNEKTVKQELRDVASGMLQVADMLFPETMTVEEMATEGVAGATAQEQAALDRYAKLLNDRAESGITQEKRENINAQLKHLRSYELKDLISRERKRADEAQRAENSLRTKDALTEIRDAYLTIKDSPEAYLREAFDEELANLLDDFKAEVGDKLAKDLTLEQLNDFNKIMRMLNHTIRTANSTFTKLAKATLKENGDAIMSELKAIRMTKEEKSKLALTLAHFGVSNLKPVYLFRYLGSETFEQVYWNLQQGELIFGGDLEEAKTFKEETEEKYHYKDFDFKKKIQYSSIGGNTFELDLDQRMWMYAVSRRPQGLRHLLEQGFTFEAGGKARFGKEHTGAINYPLSAETINEIISSLSTDEKSYVEAMQKYLSQTMAAKGNEVSMKLYGVKLFNEDTYWSLVSSENYLPKDEKENKGQFKLKNSGFTKAINRKATNPILMQGLESSWSNHVYEMSLYHGMTLPLEDMNRLYNYRVTGTEQSEGVKTIIEGGFSRDVSSYISTLMKDLNGGVTQKDRVQGVDKLIALSKKGSVLANLSVVLQQPSAIFRAMAYVDKKYFLIGLSKGGARAIYPVTHIKDWNELKKYAPIAILKEMGGFDTTTGSGAVDYLSSGKNDSRLERIADVRDNILSKAPELADRFAWIQLWHAIQKETQAKYGYKVGTEQNKVKSGERFNEVVHLTQVYDSTLSRSDNMRSKSTFAKMATSFMAEPMTYANMAFDAAVQFNRDRKTDGLWKAARRAGKVTTAIASAIVANSLLHAIAVGMRDDDEDETFNDKYWQAFWKDIEDGVNPLNYLPIARDIMSMLEGYDIKRMDMNLFSDTIKTVKKIAKKAEKGEDLDGWDYISLLGSAAAFRGIPINNLVRDIRSAVNTYNVVNHVDVPFTDKVSLAIMEKYQEAYDKAWNAGWSEEECKSKAESAAKSEITNSVKPEYLAAFEAKDYSKTNDLRSFMFRTELYKDRKGNISLKRVDEIIDGWLKGKEEEDERAKRAEERKTK